MEGEKKFKRGLLGYSKSSVNDFILKFNLQTQKQLDEKDDLIDDLKKENAQLKDKLAEFEHQRRLVGDALLNAEQKGREIVEEAIKEGQHQKGCIDQEIKHASMVLKKLNEEIRQLKAGVLNSVSKYQSELDTLIQVTDEDLKEL